MHGDWGTLEWLHSSKPFYNFLLIYSMHTKEMCIKVQKSKHLSPEHTHNQSSHEEQSMTSTEESSALRWEPAGGWSVSTWEGSHNTFILTRTIVGKCYFQKFIFKSQHKKWKKHIYNGKTPLVKVLLFPNNHILFLSNYNQRNRSKNEYMKCPHYITTIRSCINTPEGSGSSTAFLIYGLWKDSICTAISQWWEVCHILREAGVDYQHWIITKGCKLWDPGSYLAAGSLSLHKLKKVLIPRGVLELPVLLKCNK